MNYVMPNYQHRYEVGALAPGTAPDYVPYLYQSNLWPSASAEQDVPIFGMHPAQAINAFHRLTAGCDDRSDPANDMVYTSPLALALLSQAVGEDVVYGTSVQDAESFGITLEECYDILSIIDRMEANHTEANKHLHPIARARRLEALIKDALAGKVIS